MEVVESRSHREIITRAYISLFCFIQVEIYLFKEFAAKVERKSAENAALEEDYDDAPDEFKGNLSCKSIRQSINQSIVYYYYHSGSDTISLYNLDF